MEVSALVGSLILAVYAGLCLWTYGAALSPDGAVYLAPASSRPVPFSRRWLLPALIGRRIVVWHAVTFASVVAAGALIVHFTGGGWVAAVLLAGLPGLVWFNSRFPVLVDAPAFALALGSALAWRAGHTWTALILSVAAGACKETAPLFAAAWVGAPPLAVGMLGARWIGGRAPKAGEVDHRPGLGLVFRTRGWHDYLSMVDMVLPWGAVAILAICGARWDFETACAVAALALGYGQLLIATDEARLYQWAAPAVLVLAIRGLGVVPTWLVAPLLMLHLVHPWRGVQPRYEDGGGR